MRPRFVLFLLIFALAVAAVPAGAQSLADFEKSVTEHTLANGMKFIIVERRQVPVISFYTYADVGSVDEEAGRSGLAHLFEHMAFKGTSTIGSKDYKKEQAALARVDEAYFALQRERWKGAEASPERLQQLEAAFVKAAAAYAKRKSISYAAWREVGVPADVLKRAGITRGGN